MKMNCLTSYKASKLFRIRSIGLRAYPLYALQFRYFNFPTIYLRIYDIISERISDILLESIKS